MTDEIKSPPSEDAEIPGARALVRGLDVLFCVAQAPEPQKFGELHSQLGIPKGTLHRLLAALLSRQLIRYDPQVKRYSVGSRILDLTRGSHDNSNVLKSAKPELERLTRKLQVPACLYVRDDESVFVLFFEDPDATQSRFIRVWPRLDINDSAPGHAILSSVSRSDSREDEANTELSLAKALGYAVTSNDNTNTTLVAAPITNASGHPEGAIACEFATNAHDHSFFHECGRLISEAAQRASSNTSLRRDTPFVKRAPSGTVDASVKIVDQRRDYVGENPIWVENLGRLYWLDILAPALRWFDVSSGEVGRTALPEIVGGMALDHSGDLVMLGQRGMSRWNVESEELSLIIDPEPTKPDNRFNTAGVDFQGRLWAGTQALDNTPGKGSLFCINPDLTFAPAIETVGRPKNAAWSNDGRIMYFADGLDKCIWAFDVEQDGKLLNRRTFVVGDDQVGIPNGIAVDGEGGVWASMVGSWSIRRFTPDGEVDQTINLPVPMPMNLAFGGHDLKTIFVTSTNNRLPPGFSSLAPHSGKLLAIETNIEGQPPRQFGKRS